MNKIVILQILLILFVNCKSETKVNTHKTSKMLANGKHLEIKKTNKLTTQIGIFTKKNYGTTHQFSYNFKIDNGKVIWEDKGSAEPKYLLFCKDSVYVHYLNKIRVPIPKKATDTTKTITYKNVVKEFYEVYIDKRYFFRLLGEDYWIDITPEQYSNKKTNCKEYEIPNENEYELITIEIEDKPKEQILLKE